MEFILNCEKEMEMVGNGLTDTENVNWLVRYMQDSARLWLNIVRDKITSYDQFSDV